MLKQCAAHLIGLVVEGLLIGQGVCGIHRCLCQGDIDALCQVPAGAPRISGIVAGAGTYAVSAAETHKFFRIKTSYSVVSC